MEKCYNEWKESLRSYEREKRFQAIVAPKPHIITSAQILNQQRAFNPILQVYESSNDEANAVEKEAIKVKSVHNRYKTYPALQRQPGYNIITIASQNHEEYAPINKPIKNSNRKHGYDESAEGVALWNSLLRENNTIKTNPIAKVLRPTLEKQEIEIQQKCREPVSARRQGYNVITHEGYDTHMAAQYSDTVFSRRRQRYALRYEIERLKKEREDRQFDLCAKARAKMVVYSDISRNRNYDIITHMVKPNYIFNRVAS